MKERKEAESEWGEKDRVTSQRHFINSCVIVLTYSELFVRLYA
jgi:hypothetical protein